jgi:hypothetical protein
LAVLAASLVSLSIIIGLVGILLESILRHHREAYHIRLRQFGAPESGNVTGLPSRELFG